MLILASIQIKQSIFDNLDIGALADKLCVEGY
jgi:hypothetical protein